MIDPGLVQERQFGTLARCSRADPDRTVTGTGLEPRRTGKDRLAIAENAEVIALVRTVQDVLCSSRDVNPAARRIGKALAPVAGTANLDLPARRLQKPEFGDLERL